MRNNNTLALMLLVMLVLAGCASTDAVLFVTKTSLGIDFDAKPSAASIAYDRIEGYIAPSYANGEIPPVIASIKSDAKIFNPKIRQIYATGDAAVIAVSSGKYDNQSTIDDPIQKHLIGEKKLMFFGTSTTTGLKVGFTSFAPDSFVFGFKRKEYSFIPLGKHTEKVNGEETEITYDVYPSVLASIDTAANAGKANTEGAPDGDTSLSNSQFFATGEAARLLAANEKIRQVFTDAAAMSLRAGEQKVIVNEEDKKIKEIVDFYTDNTGSTPSLKKQQLDNCVNFLIEGSNIKDKSSGERLKNKVKDPTGLTEMLKGNFDKLAKPLSAHLNDNCKGSNKNVGTSN